MSCGFPTSGSSAEGVTGSSGFSQQLMGLWKHQEGQEEQGAQVITGIPWSGSLEPQKSGRTCGERGGDSGRHMVLGRDGMGWEWGWEKGEGNMDGDRLSPPHPTCRGVRSHTRPVHPSTLPTAPPGFRYFRLKRNCDGNTRDTQSSAAASRCPTSQAQGHSCGAEHQREGPSGSFVKTSTMQ